MRPLRCIRPDSLLQGIQDGNNRIECARELRKHLRVCRCDRGKACGILERRSLRSLEFRAVDEALEYCVAAHASLQLIYPVCGFCRSIRAEENALIEAVDVVGVRR